jgi:hypothetical protein
LHHAYIDIAILQAKDLADIVNRLGGFVDAEHSTFGLATHMVCSQFVGTAKILHMIARGAWILHPSYLYESDKHDLFQPVSTSSP